MYTRKRAQGPGNLIHWAIRKLSYPELIIRPPVSADGVKSARVTCHTPPSHAQITMLGSDQEESEIAAKTDAVHHRHSEAGTSSR